jgi:3-hydroxyisobutyrate dehydrogenase-like beta-hydroxyacid dehydrogenase
VDRPSETVGFIGLGQMGGGMAKNLLLAGVGLIDYDQHQKISNEYVQLGARVSKSPAIMAAQAKKIFLCFPFTPEVDVVLFGHDGLSEGAEKDLMIIDTSTIYVNNAIAFQTRLKASELSYSDCPISGLPFRAAEGSLTMMFGGTLSKFQQAKPYLDIMGRSILYCGDCGKGRMIKAFNNVVYDINLAAISEILPLAVKSGLDPNVLEQLFTTGSSRSFASEYFVPRMIERTFTGDYSLQDALKDITNFQLATSEFNDNTPMFDAMVNTYKKAIDMGFGEESKSSMLKVYEKILALLSQKQLIKSNRPSN